MAGPSAHDLAKGSAAHPSAAPAAHLLDSLDTAIAVLSCDLRVTYANRRWDAWLSEPLAVGRPFATIATDSAAAHEELASASADGAPHSFLLTIGERRVACVARRGDDSVIVEAREADPDAVDSAMQDVPRRLAEVTDMAEVLRELCDIATRRCGGTGAAVLRVLGRHGEVVAAAGDLLLARGRSFDLKGSLLEEAVSAQAIVREDNFRASGRPLMREVPELALGPMIVAPLQAHGETLGVLAVARGLAGGAFGAREVERLRTLADHAALAVHKSLLLLQAQSADKAKGRFLATMSHELRTPLTALAGYNELLIDQVIGPMSDAQLDIVERMRSVTMHLSAMIEEILAFTSLEEGREVVRPSEFLASDLLRSSIAVIQPLADQKRLRLQVNVPRNFVRMTSDIDKSRQILVNLLGNAVKFTDQGTVTVRLSSAGDSVRVDVQDTGIGISEEELTRLFRPFAQVDSGLTRRHGGTGLGLYISRRLATMLGGHIEVQSEAGVGSTFSVVLPLASSVG